MTAAVMDAMAADRRRIPVIVMVAARDVADAIDLGRHAASVGADAISSGALKTL